MRIRERFALLLSRLRGEKEFRREIMPLRKQENVGVLAAEAGTLGEEAFPLRVLFVCSGNICRSPYAHVVFERLAKKYHREVLVCSAGTLRLVGRPAAPLTIRVAAERGDDLEAHRSTALSKLLVEASDVIFAMSPEHREVMMKLCQDTPGIERRIVMLGSWLSPPEHEIVDPMGKPYEVYQRVAAEIETALERWFEAFEARDARNANTDA